MLIVYVQNVSKTLDVADYRYAVMVNRTTITEGDIKGHVRADGWAPLVKRIAEQHISTDAENGKEDENG